MRADVGVANTSVMLFVVLLAGSSAGLPRAAGLERAIVAQEGTLTTSRQIRCPRDSRRIRSGRAARREDLHRVRRSARAAAHARQRSGGDGEFVAEPFSPPGAHRGFLRSPTA